MDAHGDGVGRWTGVTGWRALAAALLACVACAPSPPAKPLELWVYCAANLARPDEAERLDSLWKRARAAGYSRVVLADEKLARLGEMDAAYFAHLHRLLGLADSLGLEVVPGVFPIGRSNALLAPLPDLAEGLPVRDALFEARGGVARLVADPPIGFPARPALVDPEVTFTPGAASTLANRGTARVMFRVKVRPWRFYRVSVRLATRGFAGEPRIEVVAGGRPIHFGRGIAVAADQPPASTDVAFHSLEHDEVAIYFGLWSPARGALAWTDWRIEETGPVNVLHRPGTPFMVRGAVLGRDVDDARDSLLGVRPWRGQYDAWHEPVRLRTRLPDGARFRASWYQAAVTHGGQVTACPAAPEVDSLLRDQSARVRAAIPARSFLMMHDEIRAMGWDRSCGGRPPGRILADHIRRCAALLEGKDAWVWSDMFDPHHNAAPSYALVHGDLSGSWEGLPDRVGVVNWNAGRARASLRFFAARGHRQIIAAYYDGRVEDTRHWLEAARGISGIQGFLYATWREDYEALERFARFVQDARR